MSVTGDVTSDTIHFGNGNDDYIYIDPNNLTINPNTGVGTFFLDHDTIVFGNGSQDDITIVNGNMDYDNIGFGSGGGDKVYADAINNSTITFGGNGASVAATDILNNNEITFHDASGSAGCTLQVDRDLSGNSNITFGAADGDAIIVDYRGGNYGGSWAISSNTITFGNGESDHLTDTYSTYGQVIPITSNNITFGNGAGDYLSISGASSNNKIVLGNGANDYVNLGFGAGVTSTGGDYLATGTGANDKITVGTHANPDTVAFALGTNGSSYTTVSGAQLGDYVVVNGGQLGDTLVSKGFSAGETLTSFLASIVSPTKDHTYVGNNGADTFIFTDAPTGHTGVIDVVGVFNPTQANLVNHVLTLA
jgi:hypothetical protein